jgi:hypothetical protein
VRALLWPLFAWSAWDQPATVVAGTKLRALLWPLFAWIAWVQTATLVAATKGEDAALAFVSLVGVGPGSNRGGLARQVRALLWHLFDSSAWAQLATVVAGMTGEEVVLASVRFVCMGSAGHCGGEGLKVRARQVRALLWPRLAWSAWAQPATAVAGTTGEVAAVASVRLVVMDSPSHCGGGDDM